MSGSKAPDFDTYGLLRDIRISWDYHPILSKKNFYV